MTQVFLKFHRTDAAAQLCLRHWLEVFRNHDTVILCDRYDPATQETPDYLKTVLEDYPVPVLNSDYSIGEKYCRNLKGAKRGMASANLTPFTITNADAFWMIDADDTLFLTRNLKLIRDKLRAAEDYLFANKLDGFSLDFYRNLNDCWTFGVCLLRSDLNWKIIKDISDEEIRETGFARNIDTVFDILRRRETFNLKNFVFDRTAFQHQENNYPEMPHGVYVWHRGKLWDKPLQEDVVVL